jgi:hypothetical protein
MTCIMHVFVYDVCLIILAQYEIVSNPHSVFDQEGWGGQLWTTFCGPVATTIRGFEWKDE